MSEVKRINKVKIKRGTSGELARLFKVSTVTVSLAVNGVNNSELAQNIRNTAVAEFGGDAIYGENEEKRQVSNLGKCSLLAKEFGVTTQTVRNALKGVFNSELAQKIRKAAVEMGGDAIYSSNNQK